MGNHIIWEKLLDQFMVREKLASAIFKQKCHRFNCQSQRVSLNWLNEWNLVSVRSDSIWSMELVPLHGARSTADSFQTARTQNPYCPHFIHENIVFLGCGQKHPDCSCSFRQRWQMQTSARLPNFFWTLDDLLGKTESNLECEMRGALQEEWYQHWCEASVVQRTETLLVKSFLPLSTYANL